MTPLLAVEIPLLSDIVVILGLATVVILAFQRLKFPTIIGFLITGVIAGPYGLSLVEASEAVDILSEIGVILLLFVIGMEFSLQSLSAIKRYVFIGGTLQVLLTIAATAVVTHFFGFDWNKAVFFGFLFSLSSTAIVLKLLQERGEVNAPHGKTILAILIFQDIIIVPMMLFTPMLAGATDDVGMSLLILGGKGLLVIVLTLVLARYVVPQLLYRVAMTKSKELFILSIVVICFAVAYATSQLGLSLGLGAFLAGLIVSESDYSHQATSAILPFREIFISFFFVSVGMLFDSNFLIENFPMILALVGLTMLLKIITGYGAAAALKLPARISMIVGFSLFQVGEFSLLLAKEGVKLEILDPVSYQYFLAVSILTMAVTPFVMKGSNNMACRILNIPIPEKIKSRFSANGTLPDMEVDQSHDLEDHLVIIGYGLNGQNVAKAAKSAQIPYVIVELNAETVKREAAKGEPIMYGDAINGTILEHLNIHKARVVVVAISDAQATKSIISNIRSISKKIYVIVRTRFIQEMEANYRLGADEVIPEEFETSIEIFTRVLNKYLIPKDKIEDFTQSIRMDNYEMLRSSRTAMGGDKLNIDLPNINFVSLSVHREGGKVVGKKLNESDIRNHFGVSVVAIKRGEKMITDVSADTEIRLEDLVYVVGTPENITRFEDEIKV
ncbi:cation:proton antiporter domain-containing protein [Penaeicola halotolerans]|uniref:cation:proton antiporter domain-containing protein n=1 Tax=Penaeicola halotolerans TaxID=2793196 RepID=UPI001CF8C42D|nr:cation:proton antiporter [Penaeicola halotolerans]